MAVMVSNITNIICEINKMTTLHWILIDALIDNYIPGLQFDGPG
jgi:hypothetical protein